MWSEWTAMIRQNQRKLNAVFIFIDILIIVLCVYISAVFVNFLGVAFSYGLDFFAYVFSLVCIHVFFYRRYDFYTSHRSSRYLFELKKIVKACLFAFVLRCCLLWLVKACFAFNLPDLVTLNLFFNALLVFCLTFGITISFLNVVYYQLLTIDY